MSRQSLILAILAWTVAVVTGCDPGYSYKPVSPAGGVVARSGDKIGEVKFTMGTYETSTSSKSIIQNLFVDNGSNADVVVLDAVLETGDKTIPAKIYSDVEGEKERTVPAKFSKTVGLAFSFGDSAAEVLAKEIIWVWQLRIGTEEHTLRVPMRRE